MQIKTFINYIKNIKTNEKIARAKRLKTLAFKQIYLNQEKNNPQKFRVICLKNNDKSEIII